jgi:hypothetical protein
VKRLVRQRVLVAVIATCLIAASESDWIRIRPPGDTFVVSIPKMYERKSGTTETPLGPVRTSIYSVKYGNSNYVVVYAEYTPAFLEKVGAELLFDAQQAQLVPKLRSKLLSQQEIIVKGSAGREIVFHSDDGRQLTIARLILVRERLYSVVGSTRRNGLPQEDIRRFLDSFEAR